MHRGRGSWVWVVVLGAFLTGCTDGAGSPDSTGEESTPARTQPTSPAVEEQGQTRPSAVPWRREVAVYTAVLERFLPDLSSGNLDPGTVYVSARAHPDEGRPVRGQDATARPIDGAVRRAVDRALLPEHRLTWVRHPRSVIVGRGCWHVRGDGVLVRLDVVPVHGRRIEVGVSQFTACLGAGGLTYVVGRHGGGWEVEGTTGSQWIS